MKTHSTNYFDTLIEVAEDTKATSGTTPPVKAKKTVAEMQYELIGNHPYEYSSDDVLFQVYAEKNNLPKEQYEEARKQFFSKGQACFRTSPLTKTYGFGVHHDKDGKMALVGMETNEYQSFLENVAIKKVKAMKSTR